MLKRQRGKDSHRNLRRHLTLLLQHAKTLGIPLSAFDSLQSAKAALAKIEIRAFHDGSKLSALAGIRHAACTLFGYAFDVSLAHSPLFAGLSKAFAKLRPTTEPVLNLSWDINDLFRYLVRLGDNRRLPYSFLMGKVLCLCMSVGGLRMAEANRLDLWATDPSGTSWQFTLRIKCHRALVPFRLHRSPLCPELDPVLALLEVRARHALPRGCSAAAGAVECNHENKNENEDGTVLQQQRSMSLASFSDPEAAVLSEATLSG
jgi:hypothetical protein